MLDLDEKAMLKDVFQRLDRDKDGIVSVADVHHRLQQMGQRTTRKKVETMVWEVDRKGDGHLDFDDFVQMFERARGDATGFEPYKLLNVVEFLMYDKSGQGTVTLEDCILILSRRFGQTNIQGIQADLRKFFLDQAGGGSKTVTYPEFCAQVEVRKMLLMT